MWIDEPESKESWMGTWRGLITCAKCWGFIKPMICPLCGFDHSPGPPQKIIHEGKEYELPVAAFAGAIEWSTYMVLELMRREWNRPVVEDEVTSWTFKVPQKSMIVILFWSLFETLMDKFFTSALRKIPKSISDDLLKRYSGIGSRTDRLYKILFGSSFKKDLEELGHLHIYNHIVNLQIKRNDFIHGNPNAIDQSVIDDTIKYLQDTQLAWIDLYNKRCTKFSLLSSINP